MKLLMRKTALLVTLAALLFGATSCSREGATGKPDSVDYYTCTMHPSVHSKDPGKCPICSMDLVPVMRGVERKSVEGGATPQPPAASRSNAPRSASDMSGMQGMQGMKGGGEMKGPQTSEFIVPVERQQQIGVR